MNEEALFAILREWLGEVDLVEADDGLDAHDAFRQIGARWRKGNYYRRFKGAISDDPNLARPQLRSPVIRDAEDDSRIGY